MVTIKDIAKAAGVSHGTASNVLNKRGNVRASKIKLVEEAAKRLGYQLNSQAQVLRKGESNKICVLLPHSGKNVYRDLVDTLLSDMFGAYDIHITYIKNQKELEKKVSKLLSFVPLAIVCVGMAPRQYDHMVTKETELILLDVYQENKMGVSFDVSSIKEQLDKFVLQEQVNRICFLKPYAEYELFQKLEQLTFSVAVHHVVSDDNMVRVYFDLEHLDNQDVLVVTDKDVANDLLAFYEWFEESKRPKLFILDKTIVSDQAGVRYLSLDYVKLAKELLVVLDSKQSRVVAINDKSTPNIQYEKGPDKTLNILTVESPLSKAIERLLIKYHKLTGVKVVLTQRKYDDLLRDLSQNEIDDTFDLIRVDMAWLPTMAKRLFVDLTNYTQIDTINHQLVKGLPIEYSVLGDIQYTLPLDVSSQVLVYRKDLFDNVLLQRQFFEKYRQQLTVPQNFHEFDTVASFFTRHKNEDSPTIYGHTLALKTPIVATCDFMPRYRERLLDRQMDLSVISETVDEYIKSFDNSNKQIDYWWGDVVHQLQAGNTAMEVVFSNYISPLFSGASKQEHDYQFDIASVPGRQAMIGGGAVGISKASKQVEESLNFLRWLYSDEIAKLLAYLGGVLPIKSVIQDSELSRMYPWFDNFADTFCCGSRMKWQSFETNLDFETLLGQELLSLFT